MSMDWKKVSVGALNYSSIIASWFNVIGRRGVLHDSNLFEEWLRSLDELKEDQVIAILYAAGHGKAKYEESAEKFLNEHSKN